MQMFLLIVLISEVSVTPTKIRYIQALGGVWYIRVTFFTCSGSPEGDAQILPHL